MISKYKIVRDYLLAISSGKKGDELEQFFDKSIVQVEYPNLLTKKLTKRNLQDIKEASIKGAKVLKKQQYEIVKHYECFNTIVIEAKWTGILAVPIGDLGVGNKMEAHFAQFYEFRGNKIAHLRNYDCFKHF